MKKNKPKTLQELANDIRSEESQRKQINWQLKREYLEKAIGALELLKVEPFFKVTVFLLKSQLAEFEIKGLLTQLLMNCQKEGRGIVFRMSKGGLDNDATMGRQNRELNEYYSPILKNLQTSFSALVKKRNLFTHHLFEVGSIDEMNQAASSSLPLVNKILEEIKNVSNTIKSTES